MEADVEREAPTRRYGPQIRRCPLDRGAPNNRRSQAPHFGNRPEQRCCTSSLTLCSCISVAYQRLSDCEDDPPEGAAFNEITQSLRRFDQRERLSNTRFDRAGLK